LLSLQQAAGNAAVSDLLAGGAPLPPALRRDMEQRFGCDFGAVRIHDGPGAEAATKSLSAKAVTIGSHIAFDAGRFFPDTQDGRRLIAHELAHVVQQRRGGSARPSLDGTGPLESDAARAGEAAANGGGAIAVSGNSAVGPAAEPDDPPKHTSPGDIPVRGRVRRSEIAGRGPPEANWESQFEPPKAPFTPTHITTIAGAQAWADDLSGYERDEARRYKIGEHLKSMIEKVPPEVWLPSNDIVSRSELKGGGHMTVTGAIGPIDTDSLRNKLFTSYLTVDHPAELKKPRDPTGLIWGDDFNIEQVATPEEQAAHLTPDPRPFKLSGEPFTRRELDVLEFLFPDEMLEWRRRDVALQESVQRERDRRTGVIMGAFGDMAIRFLGQSLKWTALAGSGAALAPGISGWLGSKLPSFAGWGGRFLVGTGTGEVLGAGTEAVDSAISNLGDLVRGDIGIGQYGWNVLTDTWSGAKGGAVFGAAAEVARPLLGWASKLVRRPSAPVAAPVEPQPSTAKPAASSSQSNVAKSTPAAPDIDPDVASSRPPSAKPPATVTKQAELEEATAPETVSARSKGGKGQKGKAAGRRDEPDTGKGEPPKVQAAEPPGPATSTKAAPTPGPAEAPAPVAEPPSSRPSPVVTTLRRSSEPLSGAEFSADPNARTVMTKPMAKRGPSTQKSGFTSSEIEQSRSETIAKRSRGVTAEPEGTRVTTSPKSRTASLSDEEMLAANMKAAGREVPPGHDAHHLVLKRGGGTWGDRARRELRRVGISVNDADNGIALPGSSVPRGTVPEPEGGPWHATMHTERYYQEIATRLRGVTDEEEARAVLRQIQTDIVDGNFPN
jgi:hypothetical protein